MLKLLLVNVKDTNLRKINPTGLLAFHSVTKNIIARGNSPLSLFLYGLYKNGFKYPKLDKFKKAEQIECPPQNYDKFFEHYRDYINYGNLISAVNEMPLPLRREIFINEKLELCNESSKFEVIKLADTLEI